jgi:hypothetical protein
MPFAVVVGTQRLVRAGPLAHSLQMSVVPPDPVSPERVPAGSRELEDSKGARVRARNYDQAPRRNGGKEPLADAVARINRYARRAIVVDPSVAQVRISGVFNAGDADAFLEGVTAYFPVRIGSSNETEVQLTARR